jgi:hypothetical protein
MDHETGQVVEEPFELTEDDPLYWMEVGENPSESGLTFDVGSTINAFGSRWPLANAFCPTGEGGGVDPSCSPGGSPKLPSHDQLTLVKSLPGSTGPKLMVDQEGKQWVVKSSGNDPNKTLRLANEVEADGVYRALGIKVPQSGLIHGPNGTAKVSEYKESATLGSSVAGLGKSYEGDLNKQIGKGFAADALMANWDVIGLSKDNIAIRNGVAVRIDNGGALLYRAQGSPKGAKFGAEVGELTSMRNPSMNPASASVFGHLSDAQVKEQVQDLVGKREKILGAIQNPTTKEIVGKRLDWMKEKLKDPSWLSGTPKPAAAATPKPSAAVTPAVTGSAAAVHVGSSPTPGTEHQLHSANGLVKHLFANKGDVSLSRLYLAKIHAMNPNGIKDGSIRVPSNPSDKKLELFKKVLPAGTVIKQKSFSQAKIIAATGKVVPKFAKIEHEGQLDFGDSLVTIGPSKTGPLSDAPAKPPPAGAVTTGSTFTLKSSTFSKTDEEKHEHWRAALSYNEKMAVSSWKGSAKNIRAVVAGKAGATEEEKARASNFMSAVGKANPWEGTTYRGVSGSWADERRKQIKAAGIGGYYNDPAPHCTSLSPSTGTNFSGGNLLFRIDGKNGRPIWKEDGLVAEKEIVGMPNAKYRIVGIHENATLKIKDYDHKVKMYVHLKEE